MEVDYKLKSYNTNGGRIQTKKNIMRIDWRIPNVNDAGCQFNGRVETKTTRMDTTIVKGIQQFASSINWYWKS